MSYHKDMARSKKPPKNPDIETLVTKAIESGDYTLLAHAKQRQEERDISIAEMGVCFKKWKA